MKAAGKSAERQARPGPMHVTVGPVQGALLNPTSIHLIQLSSRDTDKKHVSRSAAIDGAFEQNSNQNTDTSQIISSRTSSAEARTTTAALRADDAILALVDTATPVTQDF